MPQNNQELLAWLANPSTSVSHNTRTQAAQTLAQQHNWSLLQRLLTDLPPKQRWAELRFAAEGSYDGYLADLALLWDYAEQQADLSLILRCLLISASINSQVTHIPSDLLAALISIGGSQGKWPIQHALNLLKQEHENPFALLFTLLKFQIPIPGDLLLDFVERQPDQERDHELVSVYLAIYPQLSTAQQEHVCQRLIALCSQQIEQFDYKMAILPAVVQAKLWPLWFAALKQLSLSSLLRNLSEAPAEYRPVLDQELQIRIAQVKQPNGAFWAYTPLEQRSYRQFATIEQLFEQDRFSNFDFALLPLQEQHEILEYALQHAESYPALSATQQKQALRLYFRLTQQLADQVQADALHAKALAYFLQAPLDIWLFLEQYQYIPEQYYPQVFDTFFDLDWHTERYDSSELMETILDLEHPLIKQLVHEQLDRQLIRLFDHHILSLDMLPALNYKQQVTLIDHALQQHQRINDRYAISLFLMSLNRYQDSAEQASVKQDLYQRLLHEPSLLNDFAIDNPEYLPAIYQQVLQNPQLYSSQLEFLCKQLRPEQQQTLAEQLFQLDHQQCSELDSYSFIAYFRYLPAERLAQLRQRVQQTSDTEELVFLLRGLSTLSIPQPELLPVLQTIAKHKDHDSIQTNLVCQLDFAKTETQAFILDLYRQNRATRQALAQKYTHLPLKYVPLIYPGFHLNRTDLKFFPKLMSQLAPQERDNLLTQLIADSLISLEDLLQIALPYANDQQEQALIERCKDYIDEPETFLTTFAWLSNWIGPSLLLEFLQSYEPQLTLYQQLEASIILNRRYTIMSDPARYAQLLAQLDQLDPQKAIPNCRILVGLMPALKAKDRPKYLQNALHYSLIAFASDIHQLGYVLREYRHYHYPIPLHTILRQLAGHSRENVLNALSNLLPWLCEFNRDSQPTLLADLYQTCLLVEQAWP